MPILTTLWAQAAEPTPPATPPTKDAARQSTQLGEIVDVMVDKDGIRAAGQTVQTPEQLLALLADRHILKIRLHVDQQAVGYETIGKIIYGTQRASISIESLEMRQP